MTTTFARCAARLSAAALIAAVAIAPAIAQSSSERPDRILQSAHGMLGKGLYELAADEYRRFFDAAGREITPEDRTTAAYGLAVSLHRLGDREGALSALENARPAPTHPFAAEITLLQGACEYELGRYDDASTTLDGFLARHIEHPSASQAALMLIESLGAIGERRTQAEGAAAFLRAWPDDPQTGRVQLLRGIALQELGREDDASEAFAAAVLSESGDAPAAALRLANLIESSDAPRAEEMYRLAASNGEGLTRAHAGLALARLQRERGESGAAVVALEEWLNEHRDTDLASDAQLELGRALLDSGRAREALAPLTAAAEASPRADGAYWRAKALLATGDSDGAIAAFDAVASDFSDSEIAPYALYDLGVALRASGQDELAGQVFARLRSAHPRHTLTPHALYAEAAAALDGGRADDAARLASSLLSAHSGHELAPDTALLLADAQYFGGDYDAAVRTLRSLRDAAPEFEPPYTAYRLGMALRRAGDDVGAAKALSTAAEHAADDERLRAASLTLAEIAYAGEDWRAVIAHAERYLALGEDQPGARDASLKIALALAELGEHDEAIARLDDLLADPDGAHSAHAMYAKGASLRATGYDDDARELFESLLAHDDAERFHVHSMRALGAIALSDGRADDARRWFGSATGAEGGEASDAVNLAQAALAAGDAEGALEALDNTSLRTAPDSVRARGRVVEAFARARTGDHRSAIRLIDSLLAPDDLDTATSDSLAYERAVALRASGRDDEARDALLELQDSETLADRAALELAGIAIDNDDLERAAGGLDRLLAREDALDPGVRELAVYRRAVVAHRNGDSALAATLLADFPDEFPQSAALVSADLIAGRALVDLERHREAVDRLQRVVGAEPDDDQYAPALLMLAEALGETQRFEESLRAAREHLERFSGSDVWFRARFAEAWALENLGRQEEAIASYRMVADQHGGDTAARAQFQLGECLFAMGRHEEAVAELLKTDILHASPEWSAAALYEAGRCFEAMGKTGEARAQYIDALDRFPDSAWATPTRERLTALSRASTPGRPARRGDR